MKTNNIYKMMSVILVILAIMLTGCNKDEKDELSKTELLSRTWNVTSVDGQNFQTYSGLDAMQIEFKSNGQMKLTAILSGASISLSYTWNWNNNEQTITFGDGTDSMEWDVQKLTAAELWFMDTAEQVVFKCSAI
jgi:hypothetical protein